LLGDVTILENEVVVISTGVEATGQIGTVSFILDCKFPVAGIEGIGELGTVTQNSIYLVTGVFGTGQTGTVTVESRYIVTGVSATGRIGAQSPAVNVWGLINTNQNANWIQIAA
jgi:hypothetical protein